MSGETQGSLHGTSMSLLGPTYRTCTRPCTSDRYSFRDWGGGLSPRLPKQIVSPPKQASAAQISVFRQSWKHVWFRLGPSPADRRNISESRKGMLSSLVLVDLPIKTEGPEQQQRQSCVAAEYNRLVSPLFWFNVQTPIFCCPRVPLGGGPNPPPTLELLLNTESLLTCHTHDQQQSQGQGHSE